ncbi:MAG: glycosyltransferase [Caldilineaceae bacterium]
MSINTGVVTPSGQPLRILFVTAWYPTQANPHWGIFVREHAKAASLYNDITVLHCHGRNSQLDHWWQLSETRELALTEDIPTYVLQHRPSPLPRTSYFLRYGALLKAYQQLVRQGFRPDILHAHVHQVALPVTLLGKLYGIPVVITEHHSVFPRQMLSKLDLLEARCAFPLAEKVLPVSKALQHGIERYGIRARFQVVPNVVDNSLFYRVENQTALTTRPKQLLCVATMPPTHVKGITFLLEALAQLYTHRQDWELTIIGDGPVRGEYEQKTYELGLSNHVHFWGGRPKAEVAAAMRKSDLFVLPSLWENMPCVLIEAMSSGLPIVSTRTGGIPEIVDPDVGLLAQPGDVSSLHEALNTMLDNFVNYDRCQISAKAQQRYSYEAVGHLFDLIYRECLK